MSKIIHSLVLFLAVGTVILQFFTNAGAQDIEASISFDAAKANLVRVEGEFTWPRDAKPTRNLSFVQEYAGIKGLGERVSNLELKAADGTPVKYRRIQPGEYLADADFISWAYTMDLTPQKDPTAAAHVSWVGSNAGVLFIGDIVPVGTSNAVFVGIKSFPSGWAAQSDFIHIPKRLPDLFYDRSNVVYLGTTLRNTLRSAAGQSNVLLSGVWKFSDPDFATGAKTIFDEYQLRLEPPTKGWGPPSRASFTAAILKYPLLDTPGNYEADTRGNTITIISSDMPFESQSKQRLAEILRHEMFHLWFPNGVNLKGQYDWFYEGFAVYEAEKLGVAMGQIRFDDLVSTIERGLYIDRVQSRRQSLIDAGKNRFGGAGQYMYARGMLVAFLCDVAMLDASKGKQSIENLLRDLYAKHAPPAAEADAEKTVLDALRSHKELQAIVDSYILGSGVIDPVPAMSTVGLEWTSGQNGLRVAAKLSGRQKTILDKLGYNSWRKLPQK